MAKTDQSLMRKIMKELRASKDWPFMSSQQRSIAKWAEYNKRSK